MTTPREASTTPSIWALDASSMPCTSRSDLKMPSRRRGRTRTPPRPRRGPTTPTRSSTRASRSERRRCGRPSSRRRVRFEITSTRAPTRHRTAQNASAYARASGGSRGIGAEPASRPPRRWLERRCPRPKRRLLPTPRRPLLHISRRRRRRAPSGRRRTRPSRRRANDGTNGASPACRRVPIRLPRNQDVRCGDYANDRYGRSCAWTRFVGR